MLKTIRVAKSFWTKSVKTTCYIINRLLSTRIGLKTPMEMWIGKQVDYSSLHVFGCLVYMM
uniref:Retrovirus-related Pol polyprotein from transposon TNT 1-94 n=1 Tax=Cajanus cajan TaxID=3821 RepID=A0A151UAD9_CAJCA|nr:Retrovirus-related Pol polyprotein from transposon TNT 1-94 [Cajanus cajan]